MKKYGMLLGVLLMAVSAVVRADVKLAPWFTDNGVLQRGKEVPVWGWADAGEKVVVSFMGKKAEGVAGADGKWWVKLPAMEVVKEGQEMVVKGKNEIVLKNVVVGDVWVCGGQSNMEMRVKACNDFEKEKAAANRPLIRHIKVEHVASEKVMEEAPVGGWEMSSEETVGEFTAVGYFFARDVLEKVEVPIGLVGDNWGGSAVEAWISEADLRASGDVAKGVFERKVKSVEDYPEAKKKYDVAVAKWNQERTDAQKKGEKFTKRKPRAPEKSGNKFPYELYNGMIAPLGQYGIKGVLWYQGEANAAFHTEYFELFKLLIGSWRNYFGQGDVPFYWVQLADFGSRTSTAWAYLREAQDKTLVLPNTGQAVAIEVGEEKDIHPKNKQEVGRRLALIALAKDYGFKDVAFEGPRFAKWSKKEAVARMEFSFAKGLTAKGDEVVGFEVAGADRKFFAAKGKIVGEAVEVSAEEVPVVEAVRYGWKNYPVPTVNVYNGEGLPLVPFRTDEWPEK